MTDDERFEWVRRRGGDRYAAWLAAGYREWYQASRILRSTPYLLQKRIRDAKGETLYFANIWAYDHSDDLGWMGLPVTFEAECNFNGHGWQLPTFDVNLHRAEEPAAIEAFFLKMYHAMGCQPYGD